LRPQHLASQVNSGFGPKSLVLRRREFGKDACDLDNRLIRFVRKLLQALVGARKVRVFIGSIYMKITALLSVASFVLHATRVFAEPQAATEAYVASDSEKTWTVTAFVRNLGNEECKEGEEYTFRASGDVTHHLCDAAKTTETNYNWTFRSDGIDGFLSFNGTEYRLTAWTETNDDLGIEVEKLSLRVESEKNVETADIEMQRVQ
jgi:hypothetical protein